MAKKIFIFIITFSSIFLYFAIPTTSYAQQVYGIATNYQVGDSQIKPGDIVILDSKGIVRATSLANDKMLGVAIDQAIIEIHAKTNNSRAIISNGEAPVTVSAKNGGINVGDYIASSETPGVGEKAIGPGYVLGIAKTSFTPPNSQKIGSSNQQGTVIVAVNIHYNVFQASTASLLWSKAIESLGIGSSNPNKLPQLFKYLLAGLIAIVIFAIAIVIFGRSTRRGLESIGRNPLSRPTVQFGIIISFAFTAIITLIGLAVAIFIIRY